MNDDGITWRWDKENGLWAASDGLSEGIGETKAEALQDLCGAIKRAQPRPVEEPEPVTVMAGRKPGRPKQHGEKPGWMLIRDLLAVAGYERRRQAGASHSDGIRAATREVERGMAGVPISESAVRKALARWYSVSGVVQRIVKVRTKAGRKTYTASIGKRPEFPRKPRKQFDFTSKKKRH